ncbi:MAG: ABC transporter substrate-binding protein [Alphaproteobacteria bacterium]|jgi:phospholipid transport system substrate-binding protein|nr:ABC transporter substrate-binding protein [Alphaproteobacteria bacterium]
MNRHCLLVFGAALLFAPGLASAGGVSPQEFVERTVAEGMALLSDTEQGHQEAAFRAFLDRNFAMRSIARFAIGRHWREASPAQQEAYERLFEEMIVRRYTAQFTDYQGQDVRVAGSQPVGRRDALVASVVTQPGGQPDVSVDWRVREGGEAWRVVDVVVEGVSMAMTYRADFDSVVQRGGIPGLLEALAAQAEDGEGKP